MSSSKALLPSSPRSSLPPPTHGQHLLSPGRWPGLPGAPLCCVCPSTAPSPPESEWAGPGGRQWLYKKAALSASQKHKEVSSSLSSFNARVSRGHIPFNHQVLHSHRNLSCLQTPGAHGCSRQPPAALPPVLPVPTGRCTAPRLAGAA